MLPKKTIIRPLAQMLINRTVFPINKLIIVVNISDILWTFGISFKRYINIMRYLWLSFHILNDKNNV